MYVHMYICLYIIDKYMSEITKVGRAYVSPNNGCHRIINKYFPCNFKLY